MLKVFREQAPSDLRFKSLADKGDDEVKLASKLVPSDLT
jgi:hypothetical protein